MKKVGSREGIGEEQKKEKTDTFEIGRYEKGVP